MVFDKGFRLSEPTLRAVCKIRSFRHNTYVLDPTTCELISSKNIRFSGYNGSQVVGSSFIGSKGGFINACCHVNFACSSGMG